MSDIAAKSVQSTSYGVERTKQEAGELHNAANATASEAHDDFQAKVDAAADQARIKKEAAVAEGKADVEEAKATTASYLDQARNLVGTALDKAQSYVVAGQERLGATTTHSTAHVRSTGNEGPKSGGLTSTLTGAAVSALETTKGVLATAQAHIAATGQGAQAAAKPHVGQNMANFVHDTHIPSSGATAESGTSTETAPAPNQITPSTITYPKEPKTESHHVTMEGGAAPPEKVEDKAVDKLADELTSTKITDVSPATQTH